tara:strand:- start:100 stop:297 length:198 start_codon:yes stop_codon:yes gene_type:complete
MKSEKKQMVVIYQGEDESSGNPLAFISSSPDGVLTVELNDGTLGYTTYAGDANCVYKLNQMRSEQ